MFKIRYDHEPVTRRSGYRFMLAPVFPDVGKLQNMNNFFRALIAGYGAKKLGGGCLGTVLVFIIIWVALGQCSCSEKKDREVSRQTTLQVWSPADDLTTVGGYTFSSASGFTGCGVAGGNNDKCWRSDSELPDRIFRVSSRTALNSRLMLQVASFSQRPHDW